MYIVIKVMTGGSSFVKLSEKLWEMCGQSEKVTQNRRTQIDFHHCNLIFDQQIDPDSEHSYKSNEGGS